MNTRSKLADRITKAVYRPVPGAAGYEPFDGVMARALQRTPGERFGTMREFGEALQALQRQYGFEVTPLEIVAEAWLPRVEHIPAGTRGPLVSTVGHTSRAETRAQQLAERRGTDRDGIVHDRAPVSPLKAGLIGAGIGIAAIVAIGAVLWALGGGL